MNVYAPITLLSTYYANAVEYKVNVVAASARPVTRQSFSENYDGKKT